MNKGTILKVIILSISILLILVGYKLNSKNSENNKIIETNSTYMTNKTIVLDAGHGIPDQGAEGFHL